MLLPISYPSVVSATNRWPLLHHTHYTHLRAGSSRVERRGDDTHGVQGFERDKVSESGETFLAETSEMSDLAEGIRRYGTFHREWESYVQDVHLPSARCSGPNPTVTEDNGTMGG